MTASANKKVKRKKGTPHDKFAKCALKNRAIAIDFLAAHWSEIGLGKQELSTIALTNNEHQAPNKSKRQSDVVYRGRIDSQDYVWPIEHQSTVENMLLRLLEYDLAYMHEHVEQGRQGMPVVLPLCLYHNASPGYQYPTTLSDYFVGEPHSSRSWLRYGFKLVDLTVMADEEISTHGHAAILEWMLRDAFIPGEEFLERVKQHLIHPCYAAMGTHFERFKDALYEYIIDVYKGKKTPDEVIDELSQVLPQERDIMLSAGQQLRQEGRQEGMQQERQAIAKNLLAAGVTLDLVEQTTQLSKEELSRLH